MKKVEITCEECGKVIMADSRSKMATHNRCVVCVDDYLYKKDFEQLLTRGD